MSILGPAKQLMTLLRGGQEVSPDNALPVQLSGSTPVDSAAESVTVSSTAVGLTTVPAAAAKAVITVEDAEVRYWIDGSTPTASAGHTASPGDVIELDARAQVTGFSAIRTGGTDATLFVTYFA